MENSLLLLVLCCLLPMLLTAWGIGFGMGLMATSFKIKPEVQFANLVRFWLQTKQIDAATAEQVLLLLQKQGTTAPADVSAAPPAPNQPEPPPVSEVEQPVTPVSSPSIVPPSMMPTAIEPAVAPSSMAPSPPVTAESVVPFSVPPSPPLPPQPSRADRIPAMFAALLSLGTRRMLLVIGAFLVVISSLVLVIFNWNSFLPIVQVGILAVLTGGLWGLGRWVEQREGFAAAGRNLSSVAALLVPIVVFSFTRPGLLDLNTNTALLAVSSLSILLYIGGAYATRRVFYSVAASAAAVGALGSAFWQWEVTVRWQPVWAFGLWFIALLVARWLARSSAAPLALGPRIVQWAGPPLSLLVSLSLFLADPIATSALPAMIAFGVGSAFSAVAAWLERQPQWMWAMALTLPVAALIGVALPDFGMRWVNLSFAALLLGYVGMAALVERWAQAYATPLLAIAPLLLVVVLVSAPDRTAIGQSYPLLLLSGGLVIGLLERGRLAVLQPNRALAGSIGLGLTILLLNVWAASFVETGAHRGLITLVIGCIGFSLHTAQFTSRVSYAPPVLRWLGAALIGLGALVTAWLDPALRIPALALAAALYGWNAFRERDNFWALASLTAVLGVVASVIERAGWLVTFDHYLLTGTVVASIYGIGGSLFRRGTFGYWTLPALFWGGVLGGSSTLLLIGALFDPSLAALSVALIASAVWLALSFIWQRWQLGYPAAFMLAWAWLLAVAGEFLRWEGGLDALAVLALPLSAGAGLMALILRRWPRFDRPYAQLALATALGLPLPALLMAIVTPESDANLPLAAGGATLILAVGAAAYRRWRIVSLALVELVVTIGGVANWRFPHHALVIGWTLLVTATIFGLIGAGERRWGSQAVWRTLGTDSYGIGGLTGLIALVMLFNGSLSSLAWPLVIYALVIGLIATVEQSEIGAKLSIATLIGSIAGWLAQTGLTVPWQAAWLALALVPVIVAGWVIRRLALGAIWQYATFQLPLVVTIIAVVIAAGELRALVVALINAGVGFVTVTVRERRSEYAYLAGAAFVAASLGQFFVWDLREMQFYVIPVGIYLLALANGIRHFQRQDQLARLIDTSGVVVLLGATFFQAAGSPDNIGYILWVGGESLLVATYGALARLRVPFVGGVASFVLSVLWLAANAARLLNQWLLLGLLGLLMLLAYVVLERQQEQLRRAGRDWAARLQQWR
ncbi:hypothetical protein [uncultured Chloroflexus sp.]|uniref:SCO7613 C-terminal domain-containing membrane protein n=1 Tax=uncultured Chloroflexus sp. TaxID=214040 RepID=UPI002617A505|nr:hypothetical protein [uncultured Chloroflexus sp.]